MVGMGLSLGAKDFRRIAEQPRGVAVGTFVQLLLIPLLGFALGWLSGGGMLAVGIVLVAVSVHCAEPQESSGGEVSRGDVKAYSTKQTLKAVKGLFKGLFT